MAYFKFVRAISQGQPIDVYNHAEQAAYKTYNIGNHSPENLMDFTSAIEDAVGLSAQKICCPCS